MTGRRRACLLVVPAAFCLSAAVAPADQRRLAAMLACPETLPDDGARDLAVRRFLAAYARAAPESRPAEALAFRARVLRAKRCRDQQIVTVPED